MPTGEVWYRKKFRLPEEVAAQVADGGKKVFIEFEGARQGAEVFLNGQRLGLHENGVMALGFDLTPYIKEGENFIEVRTDNAWDYKEEATGETWQWNTKSFNVNYGGLPKNVWLHIADPVYQTLPLYSNLGTTGTYIYGSDYDVPTGTVTVNVESQVHNSTDKPVTRSLDVSVSDPDGKVVATFAGEAKTIPAGGTVTLHASKRLSGLHLWSWGYGYLYNVTTSLEGADPHHRLQKSRIQKRHDISQRPCDDGTRLRPAHHQRMARCRSGRTRMAQRLFKRSFCQIGR